MDESMAALLQGMPSAEETDQKLAQFQQPQSQPQQPDWMQGLPSPEETDKMLQRYGIDPSNPGINAYRTQETPGQEQQRIGQEWRQPLAQEMSQLPAASFNPLWNMFQTAGNRMLAGGVRMGAGLVGGAIDPSGTVAETGAQTAHVFEDRIKAKDEAYRMKFGHDAPWYEKLVEGIGTSVIELGSIAGKVGRAPYFAYMGDQAWHGAIKDAEENDIQGWKKYAYASVDTAIEVGSEFIFSEKGAGALAEVTGLKKIAKPAILHFLRTSGEEGAEEGVNALGQNLNHMIHGVPVAVPDQTSPTGQRQLNPTGSVGDFFTYLFNGVPMAAATGAGAGGVIAGTHLAQDRLQQQRQPVTPQNPQGMPPEAPQAQNVQTPAQNPDAPANPPPVAQEIPNAPMPQPEQPPAAVPAPAAPPAEDPPQAQEAVPPAAEQPVVTPEKPHKLTAEERRALRDKGFNNAQMNKMTTEQVGQALSHNPAPVEQPAVPHEPPVGEKPVVTPETGNVDLRKTAEMVRFYHGGNTDGGPRWVSQHKEYAEGYAEKSGGSVYYVDIPADSPHLQKSFDDTGTSVKSPYVNFEAPAEIAAQLKPVEESQQPSAGINRAGIIQPAIIPAQESTPVKPSQPDSARPAIGPKNAAPYIQADVAEADKLGISGDINKLANVRVPHKLSHYDIAERLHKQGVAKDVSHSELSRIVAAVRGDVGEWVRMESNAPVGQAREQSANKLFAPAITPQQPRSISQPLPSNPLEQNPEDKAYREEQRIRFEAQKDEELRAGLTPTAGQKPLYEMNYAEAEAAEKAERAREANIEVDVLGPELAAEFKALIRKQGSYDQKIAGDATRRLNALEESLTEQQRDRLYGIGEPGYSADDYRSLRSELGQINGSNIAELASSMKMAAERAPDPRTDPGLWSISSQIAMAQMRKGYEWAKDQGWDTKDLSDHIYRAIAQRYSDPNDAEYMLNKLNEKFGAPPKSKKITPQNPRKAIEQKPASEKPFTLENTPVVEKKSTTTENIDGKQKSLLGGTEKDLPGQKYLVPDVGNTLGEDVPEPDKERRSAAAKKGKDKAAKKQDELTVYRVADSEGVPAPGLREAVDREIAKDREHWNTLKEIVGKPLPPGQQKKLREGDVTSLKGFGDFEERREAAEQAGMDFEEVMDAIKHGMPEEPTAANEEYVRRVAGILKQELEDKGSVSFNPRETDDGIQFHKGAVPPLTPKGKPPESQPVSENSVRDELGKIFGLPIFRGRVKRNANGQYQEHDKVIRIASKMWASVVLVSHEIGHAIDRRTDFTKNTNPGTQAELYSLDYGPKKNDMLEGFAEFVRHYLTMDDAPLFPNTYAQFEDALKADENLAAQVERAKALIDRLRVRNPMDVVLSQQNQNAVELAEKNGTWDKFKDRFADWTQRYIDMFHNSQSRILNLAAAADRKAGRPVENFYNLWNRLSGSDFRRALAALEHGIHTVSGQPVKLYAKSAKEILETIQPDETDRFSGYVYAQTMLAHMARKPGYNPGRTKAELDAAIADVKKNQDQFDRFDKAARELTQYFHALVDLQAHEGAKSWEEAKRIKDSMPDYYAPIFRDVTYGVDRATKRALVGGRPGFLNAKATVRKLGQGSGDQYMDLYDSLIKENADAHRVAVQYAMIAPFLRRLLPSLGGVHGMGDQITEVDPKSVMETARLGQLLDGLTADKDKNGMPITPLVDPADAQLIKDVDALRNGHPGPAAMGRLKAMYGTGDDVQLRQLTGDVRSLREAISYFRLDFGSSDKEHIIHIHLNGKEHLVQFKSQDLWRAMRGMRNVGEATVYSTMYGAIADGFHNRITKPLQAMSVGLNPTSILRLAFEDYPGFLIQSKHTGYVERFVAPLYNIARLASAMAYEDVHGKAPKWASDLISAITPELVKREVKAGLILKGTQTEESGTVASGKLFGESKLTNQTIRRNIVPQSPNESWYRTIRENIPGALEWAKDHMAALDSGIRLAELNGYARAKGYRINKDASIADIQARKNGWIGPGGIAVDAPPATILSGMMTAQNEVITNYKPKGYVAAEVGKFIPFFTARMAGLSKQFGTIKELAGGLANVARGKDSGVEAFGPRAAAMASIATAAAMYWWFHHDDDDRKDMDPGIANRFWTFSSGGVPYAKILKPRAYGVFINAIEGLLDLAVDQKNPHILEKLGVAGAEISPISTTDIGNLPAGISTIYQLATNKDWTGRPIDNEHDVESGLQVPYRVRPWTLETSKFLSHYFTQYLGMSPAKTEYLMNQTTGTMYSDVVGTAEGVQKSVSGEAPFNWRNAPIIRGEAARGLYQRSTTEFYDLYKATESNVTTAKNQDWDTPETRREAEKLKQLDRYKDVITEIRKAATNAHDAEKKLDMDRYQVGMADYAVGKPERESYPNPLRKETTDLPKPVAEERTKFVLSLAHAMSSNPSPRGIHTKDQLEAFPERVAQAKIRSEWASQELKRLGYAPQDVAKIVITENAKKGRRTSPESVGEVATAMSK